MDVLSEASDRLSIPRHHIGCLSDTRIVCIISQDWLKILSQGRLPTVQCLDVLGHAEAEQYLAGSCEKLPKPWKKITIKVIKKTQEKATSLKDGQLYSAGVAKSLFEHLSVTSQENFRNLWMNAYKKYQRCEPQAISPPTLEFSALLKQYVLRFKPDVYVNLDNTSATSNTPHPDVSRVEDKSNLNPNTASFYAFLESTSHIFLVQPFLPYTLKDIISYSPAILSSSHMLTLFLMYQILQAMKSFHEKGLSVGDISVQSLLVDKKFWLFVGLPQLHSLRSLYVKETQDEEPIASVPTSPDTKEELSKSSIFTSSLSGRLLGSSTPKSESNKKSVSKRLRQADQVTGKHISKVSDLGMTRSEAKNIKGLEHLSSVHSPLDSVLSIVCSEGERYWSDACEFLTSCHYRLYEVEDLPRVVEDWINRRITNFKYLMILNHLAGRKMGDPNNHPVLPWILDFSSPNEGFRDLSVSKFRLNKGDGQLDFTYSTMPGLSDDGEHVPHHVSDVLSDITYYVYKARRTSKNLLCAHVRTKWVPHEYPSSIQRLQEWTPDECIPEFYTDPTLFSSIHEDLPDLEIPNWSSSTQDFIIKHMLALESEKVSENLHHWIDLTFGYKLSGSASVKAKNVYLQLVDQHKNMVSHGVMQLFSQPHPHRLALASAFQQHPPKVSRNMLQQQMMIGQGLFQDEGLHEQSSMGSFDFLDTIRPEMAAIHLPPDFHPHAELDFVESQMSFSDRALLHSSPYEVKQDVEEMAASSIVSDDMLRFACLLCEVFLAPKLRMQDDHASLSHRCENVLQLSSCDLSELPRPLHKAASILLHHIVKKPHPYKKGEHVFSYPSLSQFGHSPPTPALLLESYAGILPFPSYFHELYKCLCQLKQKDAEANQILLSMRLAAERASLLKQKEREKVPLLEQFLLKYQGKLGREGLELILPYIEELFQQETTTVQASWSFFGVISKELGPQETAKRLLPYLVSLFSGENSSAKHVKLYHRNFLMQLLVRLGLKTFLSNFSTLLVEAVAGYKDFVIPSKYYPEELMEEMAAEAVLSDAVWPNGNEKLDEGLTSNGLSSEIYPDEESSQSWETSRDENTQGDVDDIEEEFSVNILLNEDECALKDSKKKSSADSVSIGQVSNLSDESGDGENGMLIGSCDRTSIHSISNLLGKNRDGKEGTVSTTESDEGSAGEMDDDNTPVFESFSPILDTDGDSKNDNEESADSGLERANDGNTTDLLIDTSDNMVRSETEDLITNLSLASPAEIVNIRDISADSVKWLCHKLGPVLTAKYLSRNLVRMLGICYLGSEQLEAPLDQATDGHNMPSSRLVRGDNHAQKVLECLGYVAVLYGEHVILVQYLPTVVDMVAVAQRRLTHRSESGLFGAVVLLRYVVPLLSDKSLMDNLDDTVVMDSLMPVIKLVTSPSTSFPGGIQARSILSHKIIDVLYIIGLRLGLENTRKHLSPSILKFFEAFATVHGSSTSTPNGQLYKSGSLSPPGMGMAGSGTSEDSYLNIKMDPTSQEYKIGTPVSVSGFSLSSMSKKLQSNKFYSLTSLGNIDDKGPGFVQWFPQWIVHVGSNTAWISFVLLTDGSPEEQPTVMIWLNNFYYLLSHIIPESLAHFWSTMFIADDVDYRPSTKEGSLQELASVFTPELALAAYIPLCRIFGSIHMEENLPNDDLIRQLCAQQDVVMDQMMQTQDHSEGTKLGSGATESGETSVLGAIGRNVAMVGNRIQLNNGPRMISPELNQFGRGYRASGILSIHPDELRCEDMDDSRQRHLRGNWLAYWEHELGLHERDTIFNFKQIKLQTFHGHTNSIRSLFVMDNENCFISASKDKTVKLWSATSMGDGSAKMMYQWSYNRHKKSVFSVAYVDSVRQVASCDSTVHIWDPFTGVNIAQLEASRYAPVVALAPLPSPSTLIVTATTEATLRFLDLRVSKYAHEFKCSVGSAGLIRCVTVSPDGSWVAVGFSTGIISLLDVNSGILMGSWKGHDGEILQIKAYSKNKVVSSSFDGTMKLWNIEDGHEICTLKGPTEPVHCICFYRSQVLSATTANRIGVHTSVDDSATFNSTKLRSDTFKGVLTSMAILPLNRSLLLGADNGSIRLLC